MKNKYDILFSNSNCLTDKQINDFSENLLYGNDLRIVEEHLLECEICSDMADGYSLLPDKNKLSDIISDINIQVAGRVKPQGKIIGMRIKKIFAIAASVALIATIGLTAKIYFDAGQTEKLADAVKSSNYIQAETKASKIVTNDDKTKVDVKIETKTNNKTGINIISKESEISEPTTKIKNESKRKNTNRISNTPVIKKEQVVKNENKQDFNEELSTTGDINDSEEIAENPTSTNLKSSNKITASDDSEEYLEGDETEENYTLNSKGESGKGKNMFFSTSRTRALHSPKKENKDTKFSGSNTDKNGIAFKNYSQGNFKKASKLYKEIIKNAPTNYEAVFYSGMSFYNLNKYKEAIEQFKKLTTQKTDYKDDAIWYKALSLQKTGQAEQAIYCLKKLSNTSPVYKEKSLLKIKEISEE